MNKRERVMDKSKWEYKKLTDVCSILYGYPFDSKCFNETNQGRPLIRIRDVVRGYTETYTTEDCPDDYIINEGDYLVGMDGEFNISAWKSAPALLNQRVCKIAADGANLIDGFMYYLMKTKLKEIEGETAFVTVKHLSAKVLNKVSVQLPSFLDQQRIVAELDCLNEMIAVKQEQLKEFDKLAQSIFYDMFGDPVENEKKWDKRKYEDICLVITDGEHNTPKRESTGILLLSARNIHNHRLELQDVDYIGEDEFNRISKRIIPQAKDVLISCSGSVGRVCSVPDDLKFQMVRSVALLRLKSYMNNVFFEYLISSDYTQEQINKAKTNSAQANLFQGRIKNLISILPPLSLQQQFADKISAIEAQKELVKQSIAETQALLDYTMDKYFG